MNVVQGRAQVNTIRSRAGVEKYPRRLCKFHVIHALSGRLFALTSTRRCVMLGLMRKILCCLSLALLACVSATAQSDNMLAPIVRNIEGEVIPVYVTSSDSTTSVLIERAFEMHGAYKIVTADKADFVFNFTPADGNSVSLEILSGNPTRSLFKTMISGSSPLDAALRAADLAVVKTSGLKGIFAGKIAFIGQRSGATELYDGDLLFNTVRQLTHDNVQCVRPSLSPNGTSVLYTSYYRNGFPDIYKIDLNSGKRDVFLSFNGVNTGASYSPDGQSVAMILSGTGNAELYTIRSDCTSMVRLTKNKNLESDPSWSPDGARIVFASDTPGKPQLYVIDATGGQMHRLPTTVSNYCAEPSWNPADANQIAFTVAQSGTFQVAVFDVAAGESRVLTSGSSDAVEPCWTRDGRHLIYTERTPNHRRLVLLDTVTGHKAYLNSAEWGDASQVDYVYP